MPLKTHHDDMPVMNMTPMIDVVFQLIVYFMVGTSFAQMEQKMGLKVPEVAGQGSLSSAPSKKVVNVYRNGEVTLDRQTVSLADLTNRLAAARSQYKGLGVVVRGDADVHLQRVAEVLQACRKSGVADMAIAVRLANPKR
jgi:biopolymer transport protein ExbD